MPQEATLDHHEAQVGVTIKDPTANPAQKVRGILEWGGERVVIHKVRKGANGRGARLRGANRTEMHRDREMVPGSGLPDRLVLRMSQRPIAEVMNQYLAKTGVPSPYFNL